MSLIKPCRKLRIPGPPIKGSALGRKLVNVLTSIPLLPRGPGLPFLPPVLFGGRVSNQGSPVVEDTFFAPAFALSPFTHFQVILCLASPCTQPQGSINHLPSPVTGGGGSPLHNLNKKDCCPSWGQGVGRDARGLKEHFGARPREVPRA